MNAGGRAVPAVGFVRPYAGVFLASMMTALIGWYMATHTPAEEYWVVAYGYTPLMAVPWVIALWTTWARHWGRTSLLLLLLCAAAQYGCMLWKAVPVVVVGIGAISAIGTGLISGLVGNGRKPGAWHLASLCAAGGIGAALMFIRGGPPLTGEAVTLGVACWQMLVGALLVWEGRHG